MSKQTDTYLWGREPKADEKDNSWETPPLREHWPTLISHTVCLSTLNRGKSGAMKWWLRLWWSANVRRRRRHPHWWHHRRVWLHQAVVQLCVSQSACHWALSSNRLPDLLSSCGSQTGTTPTLHLQSGVCWRRTKLLVAVLPSNPYRLSVLLRVNHFSSANWASKDCHVHECSHMRSSL